MLYNFENGVLTLFPEGRIDSGNASSVESEILTVRSECPAEHIVLDLERLEYISSAGLRVVLRIKKEVKDTVIINAAPEVYDIFDMTGFVEMMEVRRAFRVISVEGCEVIGEGANGKVYRIDPDTIVKVYLNPDSLDEINRERELARTAFINGIPTAIPYDVVKIEGGGYGSVFELLNAESFARILKNKEMSIEKVAEMSIELLKTIHSTEADTNILPDIKATAFGWVSRVKGYLTDEQMAKTEQIIREIPDVHNVLHGDYHLKNVMVQNGECLLIDMDTLCWGHPVFELAAMFNAYCGFYDTDHEAVKDFLGITYEEAQDFWKESLRLYFEGTAPKEQDSILDKARLFGYTRILGRTVRLKGFETEEGQKIIDNCIEKITEILEKL